VGKDRRGQEGQVYRSWLWGSLQNKMTVKRNPNEIDGLIDLCEKGDEITLFGGVNYRYSTVLSRK
jgi:hypothetical protein